MSSREPVAQQKFGTFKGVFTPSLQTIFGVVMYLRMGWVLGQMGLFTTLVIVTLASAITFFTALSISATATNMKIAGGGAYYMISRSLGLELGAAVGIPLFLAQALGVSFYLAGFAESLQNLIPFVPQMIFALGALAVIAFIAYTSTDLALKAQFGIFALILMSLVCFFTGGTPSEATMTKIAVTNPEQVSFWVAFAVFFPAVTGIEAGLSMSGDLKNSARSLPLGTLGAVLVGYLVYIAIPVFMSFKISDANVLKSSLIFQKMSRLEPIVTVAIFGAAISSGLGALMGAPRTLQALARDGVLSRHLRILGKGYGPEDTPRVATAVSIAVGAAGIILGDLNTIAPYLSMFFLTSYGVLNFSAGIEGMIANPSWRPEFRVPWSISLIGAVACFAIMFMIDPGATIVALVMSFAIFYYMQRKKLRADFGDMRRGILMFFARYSILRLNDLPPNVKSWRPNVLVFSGSPTSRWYLVQLADAITNGKGFLTVATILPRNFSSLKRIDQVKKTIHDYLHKNHVPALVNVTIDDDLADAVFTLVHTSGLGTIVPNTIMLGETEKEARIEKFVEMCLRIHQAKRNLIIVRENSQTYTRTEKSKRKRIDVWWGREQENASFSLVLGYMLQNSAEWAGAELNLKTITSSEEERNSAVEYLNDFIKRSRIDAKPEVYLNNDTSIGPFHVIERESRDADLVFIGMVPPELERFIADPEDYTATYANYYRDLIHKTAGFPKTAIVLTGQEISFSEIFT